MIEVIVLDIDGTLLRSDGTVSRRTVEALNMCKSMGKKVVIASARPKGSIEEILPEEILRDAVVVCYNGAEIYENGQRVHYKHLNPASSKFIIEWIMKNSPGCRICVERDSRLYANQPMWEGWEYEIADLIDVVSIPSPKILVDLSGIHDRDVFLDILPGDCSIVTTDDGALGHIMAESVSKAAALMVLLERWGLTMENVMAFGDDDNDIAIIKASGIGVAMGNGIPGVKEAADIITKTNDEDGIAEVLEAMFLDEGKICG